MPLCLPSAPRLHHRTLRVPFRLLSASLALLACGDAPRAGSQASAAGQADAGPPLARAEAAFMRHDFAGAEGAFREALASDTAIEHRKEAAGTLATIAWRLRRDSVAASRVLAELETHDRGRFVARVERARMLHSFGNVRAARVAAPSA
ncbi:MAG: hypothetical protein WKG32_21365, partial [Gemmatimonadaceae bacterium]